MRTSLCFTIGFFGTLALGCTESVGDPVSFEEEALFTGLAKGIRRDYDGDGKEDILISNSSGTYEYRGASPSGFTSNAWVRTDLTLSNSRFTYGDFNKDGKSDVIITTPGGSYEYTGKTGGGFNSNVWTSTSTDFKLGNVDFTVGDFNGDGWSDFIATTSSGSKLYTGKGTGGTSGGFTLTTWSKSALKKGQVLLTRGNFNGDATTDLLVTNSTTTFEYTGNTGTGGFTEDTNPLADWRIGGPTPAFTTGDFNKDGRGDFVIQTAPSSGSDGNAEIFYGQAGVGFVPGGSIGAYNLTTGPIIAGDYNNDGFSDLLVPRGEAGTGEILGRVDGFGTPIVIDSRFHFYDTSFIRGDYNGDGSDDFISISPSNALYVVGATEATGKAGAAGGFNKDVWTRQDLVRENNTIY